MQVFVVVVLSVEYALDVFWSVQKLSKKACLGAFCPSIDSLEEDYFYAFSGGNMEFVVKSVEETWNL